MPRDSRSAASSGAGEAENSRSRFSVAARAILDAAAASECSEPPLLRLGPGGLARATYVLDSTAAPAVVRAPVAVHAGAGRRRRANAGFVAAGADAGVLSLLDSVWAARADGGLEGDALSRARGVEANIGPSAHMRRVAAEKAKAAGNSSDDDSSESDEDDDIFGDVGTSYEPTAAAEQVARAAFTDAVAAPVTVAEALPALSKPRSRLTSRVDKGDYGDEAVGREMGVATGATEFVSEVADLDGSDEEEEAATLLARSRASWLAPAEDPKAKKAAEKAAAKAAAAKEKGKGKKKWQRKKKETTDNETTEAEE